MVRHEITYCITMSTGTLLNKPKAPAAACVTKLDGTPCLRLGCPNLFGSIPIRRLTLETYLYQMDKYFSLLTIQEGLNIFKQRNTVCVWFLKINYRVDYGISKPTKTTSGFYNSWNPNYGTFHRVNSICHFNFLVLIVYKDANNL